METTFRYGQAKVAGIDGCRAGWCVIFYNKGVWDGAVFSSINDIIRHVKADLYLIDMPIGLSDAQTERTVDKKVREMLRPYRSSSVFTPPCRDALMSKDYREACAINFAITGKKISKQSWNISGKIYEVDIFLRSNSHYRDKIIEAHPELCFAAFNGGQPMRHNKGIKSGEGYKERLSILQGFSSFDDRVVERLRSSFKRSQLRDDDILDAYCLGLTALCGRNAMLSFVENDKKYDSLRLPMRLAYYKGRGK